MLGLSKSSIKTYTSEATARERERRICLWCCSGLCAYVPILAERQASLELEMHKEWNDEFVRFSKSETSCLCNSNNKNNNNNNNGSSHSQKMPLRMFVPPQLFIIIYSFELSFNVCVSTCSFQIIEEKRAEDERVRREEE